MVMGSRGSTLVESLPLMSLGTTLLIPEETGDTPLNSGTDSAATCHTGGLQEDALPPASNVPSPMAAIPGRGGDDTVDINAAPRLRNNAVAWVIRG